MNTLYTYFRSSAAYRVRLLLALKGIAYENAFINLREGVQRSTDYLDKNPQGLIPAWADENGLLTQSFAIMLYLEDTHNTPALLPKDAYARAQNIALAQHIACDIHPLNNLRVLNYLKNELKQDADAVSAWYAHWVSAGFDGIEAQLKKTAGKFSFGDEPSFADCFLIPQIYNAKRYDVDLSAYPTISRIWEHAQSVPEFIAASPANQPDCDI